MSSGASESEKLSNTEPPPKLSDERLATLSQNNLRVSRSQITRLVNKVEQTVSVEEASKGHLLRLNRSKSALGEAFQAMREAFKDYTSNPHVLSDPGKVAQEFDKHDEYVSKFNDAVESLQQKIDELSDMFDASTLAQSSGELHFQAQEQYDQLQATYVSPAPEAELHPETPMASYDQYPSPLAETAQSHGPPQYVIAQDPSTKVPKFNGDPIRFREWWDLFSFYVDSRPIQTTEKCRILKNSLVGKAAKIVYHLNISEGSYELMKDIVISRLGKDDDAKTSHVKKIMTLCNRKDLHCNDKFIDFALSLAQHVNSLVALGNGYDTLSVTLTPVILACLPDSYRIRFNQKWFKADRQQQNELENLMEFLDSQSSILEQSEKQAKFLFDPSRSSSKRGKSDPQSDKKKDFRNHQGESQFAFAGTIGQPDHSCIFCGKDHYSLKCTKKLSPEERRKCAESQNACLRCLRRNHTAKKCRAKVENCANCSGRHSKLVCTRQSSDAQNSSTTSVTSVACQQAVENNERTLLQTGYVWVIAGNKRVICRAILDPGSQKSFVSKKVVDQLGVSPIERNEIKLHGVGGTVSSPKLIENYRFRVKSRFSAKKIIMNCLAVPKVIEGNLPRAVCPINLSPIADKKEINFSEEVDLLIGSDYLHLIYDGMYQRFGDITASPTIFGWFLWGNGGTNQFSDSVITSIGLVQTVETSECKMLKKTKENLENLEFLWNSEILGIENSKSDEENAAAADLNKFFKETIKRSAEGRYIVSLPFRENIDTLGDNEKIAYSRLQSFLKNAGKKPELLRAVDEEIKKYIDSGFAEKAKARKAGERAHYLPLLAVAKKSLANSNEFRVRLVKDGGCRSRDEASLNDVLEKGDSQLPDIIAVLLQFRKKPIAIIADIERAFMQFLINENHRTFLRFYWPLGISTEKNAPVQEFWATVLDFGLICSPYLHCAGIRHHLDEQIALNPSKAKFLKEIRETFYMDDICTGATSLEEAKRAANTLIEVFEDGHFPLGKWATNDARLARYLESRPDSTKRTILSNSIEAKFLGVPWNQIQDRLYISVDEIEKIFTQGRPTKRKLLKGLSALFDPLGFLASISINFKTLTQTLWKEKIEWDEPLTADLEEAYSTAVGNLVNAKRISVNRCLFPSGTGNVTRELHVFADASLKAYGAVAYLREMQPGNPAQSARVTFILAKARVAPLKGRWTIHRLELLAAIIAARLAKKIKESLADEIRETYLYSDNSAVLGWLRDNPDRWKTFIANRIRELQSISEPSSWSYIRSECNPADLLSRGAPLETQELRDFWLAGPSWLARSEKPAFHDLNAENVSTELSHEKKTEIIAAASASRDIPEFVFQKKYSSWPKAVRVLCYVLRFVSRQSKQKYDSHVVNSEEFLDAESILIRTIQRKHFSEELRDLNQINRSSALFQLNPQVDENGFLRCKSRLVKASNLSFDEKFPIILPGSDFWVQLLIRWIHSTVLMHSGGTAALLQKLRERFLITKARRAANSVIAGCKVCVRFTAKPASEPIPPLPAFRIDECPPFTISGADHLGPIYIKDGKNGRIKAYVLLFTCAVTRAVRLELVADLSTAEFLLALRRFLSTNPAVERIVSDNARTFKRAQKELEYIFDNCKKAECQSFLAGKKIVWQFSTERAPWQGGFWERLVSVVKRPLRKVLGTHALSFRELETVLKEIEKIVNDRPITAVVVNENEPRALCPSDLLYGYASKPSLPDTKKIIQSAEAAKSLVFSQRWRNLQATLRGFWKRFHNEYLQYLRSAHYAAPQNSRPLEVGDVCLLHSTSPSRAYWPICIVQSFFGGEDSDRRQRSCVVKTATGQTLRRPIQLLYKLEISQF